ncbi:MAG TPA: hypothetical protein VLM77_01615 [Methanobacterium sp.]|nr:hypothetical protein [Methanobacterium sp.]
MSITSTLAVLLQSQLRDTNSVDNVAELLMKGGYIMIPIILLSIISIYIFIERFIYIRRSSVIDEAMVSNVITGIRGNRKEEALNQLRSSNSSLGRILESGLSYTGKTPKETESYMEATANLEISVM